MYVMIDMVLNHAANDNVKIYDNPDWFYRDSTGAFSREVPDWYDITDWNFDNPEVHEFLTGVLLFWVQEYDVDGYHCDVAGMVPDEFWKNAIPRLIDVKPDIFMLAEGDSPVFIADGFHAVYDWDLYHRMRDHVRGDISLDSLWMTAVRWHLRFPEDALPLRFIENHDQLRAMETFGTEAYSAYAALIFTLPGVPLLYNGQEIGAAHRPSLFEVEPVDWNERDDRIESTYLRLLRMRNGLETLQKGDFLRVKLTENSEILTFFRSFEGQKVLVLINFSGQNVTVTLPESLETGEIFGELYPGDDSPLNAEPGGDVLLSPYGFRLFAPVARGGN